MVEDKVARHRCAGQSIFVYSHGRLLSKSIHGLFLLTHFAKIADNILVFAHACCEESSGPFLKCPMPKCPMQTFVDSCGGHLFYINYSNVS